jgi:hypothetical protein
MGDARASLDALRSASITLLCVLAPDFPQEPTRTIAFLDLRLISTDWCDFLRVFEVGVRVALGPGPQ